MPNLLQKEDIPNLKYTIDHILQEVHSRGKTICHLWIPGLY